MTQIDKSRFEWIGSDSARREGISRPSTTFWKDAIGRLMKNKVAVVCFFIIVLLILSCIIVPFFSPFESREQHLGEVNKGFMTVCTDSRYEGQHHVHYFGTDNLGRDLFLRAFEGGRVSLMIAFAAVFVNLIVGLIYGGISGYIGGAVDTIMMRIVDIVYSLPDMLIIILLSVVFQERLKPLIEGTMFEKLGTNMISMFIVFGLLYWVSMARLIRGQILTIKNNEYVLAARCIGTRNSRILTRHILPNCLSVIIITTALQVPSAIFTESYLSFLGLGVSAPLTSLGSLANDARSAMQSYPYRLVIPAVLICLIVLALNLLGDGLRDAFDSKLN